MTIPPNPRRQRDELAELRTRGCYLSYAFFHRSLSLNWLKSYLLLFDNVVFDGRFTASQQNSLMYRDPDTWSKIQDSAIFLEDFEGFPDRLELREGAVEALSPMVTTKYTYDPQFIRQFARLMRMRNDGPSDWSARFDILLDVGLECEAGEVPVGPHVDDILIDELLDTYTTCRVLAELAIPAGTDPLSNWLSQTILRETFVPLTQVKTFRNLVIEDIPNFDQLSWGDVLELRGSKHRAGFLTKLSEIATLPGDILARELKDSLWRIATEVRHEASVPKTVLKGIVGNIPLGPIPMNPLSMWWSAKSSWDARNRNNQYAWLFFLSELREKAVKR
jgi:hypothetical protein